MKTIKLISFLFYCAWIWLTKSKEKNQQITREDCGNGGEWR